MKIAVIGTGIAGNVAAFRLAPHHDITVFEKGDWIGGHTNTVDVNADSQTLPVDTGFIVFNDRTYPNFIRLLDELGQASQPSVMSFSVQTDDGRLEYNGASLNTVFAQRRNLFRPSFHRMLRDILRFNKEALDASLAADDERAVGDFLDEHGYGREFREHYLLPMAAAIWSAEPGAVNDMPIRFLLKFFANHGLLQLKDRPQWRVIKGGSRAYVDKLVAGHRDRIRLRTPVLEVRRDDEGVDIRTADGAERFDYVFFACHSDQALTMLADPSDDERRVLGAIQYQNNEAILHTDASLMPQRRRAWAAWNYHLPQAERQHVAVTYNMNILQSLPGDTQYLVTLNNSAQIDPNRVLYRVTYEHPILNAAAVAAQTEQPLLNFDRTFYCGAYWRNGFHEDGVVSALDAVAHFEERLTHGKLHLRRAS